MRGAGAVQLQDLARSVLALFLRLCRAADVLKAPISSPRFLI